MPISEKETQIIFDIVLMFVFIVLIQDKLGVLFTEF